MLCYVMRCAVMSCVTRRLCDLSLRVGGDDSSSEEEEEEEDADGDGDGDASVKSEESSDDEEEEEEEVSRLRGSWLLMATLGSIFDGCIVFVYGVITAHDIPGIVMITHGILLVNDVMCAGGIVIVHDMLSIAHGVVLVLR